MGFTLEWLESNPMMVPLAQHCLSRDQRNQGLVGPGWPQQGTLALYEPWTLSRLSDSLWYPRPLESVATP